MNRLRKRTACSASAVSIIGGADGPTSVFLIGRREKNPFRRMKHAALNGKYRRKRRIAERSIVPGAHTMQETLQYAKERYGFAEADSSYRYYEDRKRSFRHGQIYRKRPELLREEKKILPPEDFHDIKAVQEWEKRIQEQTAMREKEADAIPQEVFPTDYHLFVAETKSRGRLEMEVDLLQGAFAISYSGGEKKAMDCAVKEIYRYYGVSQEDIAHKTERYKELLMVLSM